VPLLTLKEISNLDVAVAGHHQRCTLLDLLSGLTIEQFTISRSSVSWLVSRKVSARSLTFRDGVDWFKHLSPDEITTLIRNCSELVFRDYNFLDKDYIEHLVAVCPLLRILLLEEPDPLHTNRKIVANNSGQARSVASSDTSSIDYCTLLPSLHATNPLVESINIKKEGPLPLDTIQQVVESLPRLKRLNLVSVFYAVDPTAYSNNFTLSSVNITLQSLTLHRYSKLRDVAVVSMVKCLPKLTHLNLNLCKRLTDVSVISIAEELHHLVDLRLECIPALTDASLLALGEHSTRLTSLYFDANENFTDHGVTQLAKGCTKLQRLSLSGCIALSCASYVAICMHCPDKRGVGLCSIPGISCDDIEAINNGLYEDYI